MHKTTPLGYSLKGLILSLIYRASLTTTTETCDLTKGIFSAGLRVDVKQMYHITDCSGATCMFFQSSLSFEHIFNMNELVHTFRLH